MPIIPIRQRQVGPSDLGTTTRIQPVSVPTVNEGLQTLSKTLENVGSKLQEQHDIATSQDMMNSFSDEARSELTKHLSRQGGEAKGSLEEYQTWYDKRVGELNGNLQNGIQQQIFRKFADRQRDNDLGNLANHQARQHRIQLESMIPKELTSAEQKVAMVPDDDETFNEAMDNIKVAYSNARSGVDNSADIAKAKAGLQLIRLQSLTKTDPEKAKEKLEAWREDLGEAYLKAQDIVNREYVYDQARKKFPGKFERQEGFIENFEGIGEQVKKAASGYVRADKAETDRRLFEKKKAKRLQVENDFWDAMIKGNRADARRIVESMVVTDDPKTTEFTNEERAMYIKRIESDVKKTDPAVFRDLLMDVRAGRFLVADDLFLDPRVESIANGQIGTLIGAINRELKDPSGHGAAIQDAISDFKTRFKKQSDFTERLFFFKDEFLKEIEIAEKAKKRSLSPNEVRQLYIDYAKTKEDSGHWYVRDKTRFEKQFKASMEESEKKESEPKSNIGKNIALEPVADDPAGIFYAK